VLLASISKVARLFASEGAGHVRPSGAAVPVRTAGLAFGLLSDSMAVYNDWQHDNEAVSDNDSAQVKSS
jgi:hypothetical protein